MIGTALNVAGIVIGGIAGMAKRSPLSAPNEAVVRVGVAVFTIFFGLRLTWSSLSGPFMNVLKQVIILLAAMTLGKLLGRLMRLQQASNSIGRWAQEIIQAAKPGQPSQSSEGFKACAALFCTEPLGILGALQDGLNSPPYFYTLAIKGVVDGLATMGLIAVLGRWIILAAIPVLAFQGTITLLCTQFLQPVFLERNLIAPINMVGGMLVFSVALVMLGWRKIELADYLPSLFIAPLIAALWR